MKIAYVNGYNISNYKGTKHIFLSKALNEDIKLVEYRYKDNNIKEIDNKIKDMDLVIASSTGAYLARHICYKYNIPLISLNPVIDLKTTFSKIGVEVPNIKDGINLSLQELILLNEDDELIDYRLTKDLFYTQTVVFKEGTHRFYNLEETVPYIKEFMDRLFI